MSASAEPARVLGVPLGDFGLFSCLLLSVATGFLTFFGSCFLAIVGLLIWNTATHAHVSYTDTYRFVALPAGLAAMACGFVFLLGTWLRRKIAGGR